MPSPRTPAKTTNTRARAGNAPTNRKPPVTQVQTPEPSTPSGESFDPLAAAVLAARNAAESTTAAPSHTQSVMQEETPATEGRHVLYLVNPETGRYERTYTDVQPEPVFVAEDEDDKNMMVTDIQDEWVAKGKGDMQWKWLHTNAKYSENERARGYLPVDPARFKTNRFMAQNLPGIGLCYVYKDCYLCEIPLQVAEARRAAGERRVQREQREILMGIDESDAAINDEYGDLITVTRARDLNGTQLERKNPIQDEVDSIDRAVSTMQRLTGRPGLYNGIAAGSY